MSRFVKKYMDTKVADVDQKTKSVVIAVSQMEDVDRDKDLIVPGAWDVSIKQNGPKGSNEIWHLLDHTKDSFSALSKPKEIWVDGKYLLFRSEYKNSFAWREVAWPLYEAGEFTQHSVGFQVIQEKQLDDYNEMRELKLYEGSAVLWGAQPDTPTMQVVKSIIGMNEEREITAEEKIDEIIKRINKGKFDEDQSLLIIELRKAQNMFSQIKARQPVVNTVAPDEEYLSKLKQAITLLTLQNFK